MILEKNVLERLSQLIQKKRGVFGTIRIRAALRRTKEIGSQQQHPIYEPLMILAKPLQKDQKIKEYTLDYNHSVLLDFMISLDNFLEWLEPISEGDNTTKLQRYEIVRTNTQTNWEYWFEGSQSILGEGWGTHRFALRFNDRSSRGEQLLSKDLLFYPDLQEAVRHQFGIDLLEYSGLVGYLNILIPNYEASIDDIDIGPIVQIKTKLSNPEARLIMKAWAIKKEKTFSDSKEVKQRTVRFDIGYFPQLLHVILLDASSGEKLDEFRNFTSIEEKYFDITTESVKIAIRKGEGETTEFKEQIPTDLGKHLVAFANTIGGQIIIGVDNEGQPVSVKDVRKEADRAQQVAGACNPPIKIQTDIITIENKALLVISIPKSKHELLHQFRGIIYVRRGATTGRASPIEIKEMQDRQKSPHL